LCPSLEVAIKARGLKYSFQSIITHVAPPPLPLAAVVWTPALADALAEASAALARLDARVSASSLRPGWILRASWAGYAAALRLQQSPVEEIDIIAERCGLRLPGRALIRTEDEPFAACEPWLAALSEPEGRHWTDGLPFTFDPPEGWREAPALVRALHLLDASARADRTVAPWLAFPLILRRIGLTRTALPCMAPGEPAQRFASDPRPLLLKRLLKAVRRQAEDGLERLDRLEASARRSALAIAQEHRPGKLADLARLALTRPCLAARSLAPLVGVTVSGAGKLLERATALGIMVEISGRGSWRTYVAPDVAQSLGLRSAERGRPPSLSTAVPEVADILAGFDSEMAEIEERLRKLGIAVED